MHCRQCGYAPPGGCTQVGSATVKVMDLLDRAHTSELGVPGPVRVTNNKVEGHCILASGHDLLALKELLEQTGGRGVNIYTHSEMLPAHGYPELNRHPHLKGNVGKAWYDQREVFEKFPGAILATPTVSCPSKRGLTATACLPAWWRGWKAPGRLRAGTSRP